MVPPSHHALYIKDSQDLQMFFAKSSFVYKKDNLEDIKRIINFSKGSYMIEYCNNRRVFKMPGKNNIFSYSKKEPGGLSFNFYWFKRIRKALTANNSV